MFDVGFQEITLIGVIALIVVGPERLPKMARTLGLWMGKVRFYVNQVKSDIDREVRAQELKEMLDKPSRELEDVYKVAEETKDALGDAKGALGDAKASLDSTAAEIATPGDPAAGSIFPPRPPEPEGKSAPDETAMTDESAATDEKPEIEEKAATAGEPETEEKSATDGEPMPVGESATETASATVDPTPEEPPESADVPPADGPEIAPDEPSDHGRTPAAASAGEDNERTSGRV